MRDAAPLNAGQAYVYYTRIRICEMWKLYVQYVWAHLQAITAVYVHAVKYVQDEQDNKKLSLHINNKKFHTQKISINVLSQNKAGFFILFLGRT